MSCFKLFIPKDALDEPYRAAPGDLSALPSVPDVLPDSSVERQLKLCASVSPPDDAPLSELITRSSAFPLSFPVNTVRCSHLLNKPDLNEDILQRNTNSAYPVLHEKAFYLAVNFLKFKQEHGTKIERNIYSGMDILGLIQRLLEKRAATFVGIYDMYLLQNNTKGCGGWDDVGTEKEVEPLLLQNCLSYDEMKLSALLSVSSHTVFINTGRRGNRGVETDDTESFQRQGVIVGLIGTRLPRPGVMEAQEVLITPENNNSKRGYGMKTSHRTPLHEWRQIWANFYGLEQNFPTYHEAEKIKSKDARFVEINDKNIFDNLSYQRRLTVSFETLLLEAHTRAKKESTTAFVHIVGIGLGVWRVAPHQEHQYIETFISCVKRLVHFLSHVGDLRFAWFPENCRQLCPTQLGHIRIHFSNDDPQTRLEDQSQLLVVSYAWDSNSLPGNEYWCGNLDSSSDPAAASCSQVAELHNAKVNPAKVCASNLHLACPDMGVIHIAEYARRRLGERHKLAIDHKLDNNVNSETE